MVLPFRPFLFLICGVVLAAGCGPRNPETTGQVVVPSMETWFGRQADSLTATKGALEKIILRNGVAETLRVEHPEWRRELKPFMDSGIDKPALANSYRISEQNGWSTYTALDPSAQVKSLQLHTNHAAIDSVIIIREIANFYYASFDTLHYSSRGSFTISTLNKPVIGHEIRFGLRGSVQL